MAWPDLIAECRLRNAELKNAAPGFGLDLGFNAMR